MALVDRRASLLRRAWFFWLSAVVFLPAAKPKRSDERLGVKENSAERGGTAAPARFDSMTCRRFATSRNAPRVMSGKAKPLLFRRGCLVAPATASRGGSAAVNARHSRK